MASSDSSNLSSLSRRTSTGGSSLETNSSRTGGPVSRPQNFNGGRRFHGKKACLWGCGKRLSDQEFTHHIDEDCPKRNDVDAFQQIYLMDGNQNIPKLVEKRHPNGRPVAPDTTSEYEEYLRKKEEAKEISVRKIRNWLARKAGRTE